EFLSQPFAMPEPLLPAEPTAAFQAAYNRARNLWRAGDFEAAAEAYAQAAHSADDPRHAGEVAFARAYSLLDAGRSREADEALLEVRSEYANVRDRHGLRLGDLAALRRAELWLEQDPATGRRLLDELLDELLSTRWVI